MLYQPTAPDIRFSFLYKGISLTNRRRLKAFIIEMFRLEKTVPASVQYVFCSDEYLLKINRQFLQHDFYTDIITFNLAKTKDPVEGEIYISLNRVKDNARLLKQPVVLELHRVIFHGILHLCGYKDKTQAAAALMRKKEDYYLALYLK